MIIRAFDILASLVGLVLLGPLLLVCMFLVWRVDRRSPFYVAERVGLNGEPFRMVKLRSMVVGADKSGVDSTSSNDGRITAVGHFLRRYKVDELPQLWNVLRGQMSLVGPRPNVRRETVLYTREEQRLLSVRPGITDISSIVFADEGEILQGHADPDLAYNQLIRPWKSRLSLVYVDSKGAGIYISLILLTFLGIFSRSLALKAVSSILARLRVSQDLIDIALRTRELYPYPPPGMDEVVTSRQPA